MAGKGIKNDKQKAAVLGSVAGAQHVRLMAKHYGVPVVLHSGKLLLDFKSINVEMQTALMAFFRPLRQKTARVVRWNA